MKVAHRRLGQCRRCLSTPASSRKRSSPVAWTTLGIVPVHEVGVDGTGRAYFTMRLVRGQDLSQIFARARTRKAGWSQERALGVVLKVCEAMAYAHSRGVIHRDLKPANVMVGRLWRGLCHGLGAREGPRPAPRNALPAGALAR